MSDECLFGDRVDLPGADVVGVAEYGHAVSQAVHVLHSVGDENNRNALGLQLFHDAVKLLTFVGRKAGRRFI